MRITSSGPAGGFCPTTPESVLLRPPAAGVFPGNNFGYSPVMCYYQVERDLTPPDNMPVFTVVNNDALLSMLFGSGRLDLVANRGRINAHVLCQ